MPDNHEKRISTSEADIKNIGLVIIEFKDYMRTSLYERAQNHSEIIDQLATIKANVTEFRKYQESCDHERQALADDILAIKLENSHRSGKASVWALIISIVTSGAIAILGAFYGAHK